MTNVESNEGPEARARAETDSEDSDRLMKDVVSLVGSVRENLHSLLQSWKDFQHLFTTTTTTTVTLPSSPEPPEILKDGSADSQSLKPPSTPPLDNPASDNLPRPPPQDIDTPPSPVTSPSSLPPPDSLPLNQLAPLSPLLPPYVPSLKTPPYDQPPPPKITPPLQITPPYKQAPPKATPPTLMVQVPCSDLDRLTTEALMLKELLPTVLNSYYTSCVSKVPLLEERVGQERRERAEVVGECKKVRRQYDVLLADYEQERKELFTVRSEVRELKDMLTQQAEYCSSMGSACCMLLWRVSRHDECVQSILSGSKVDDFLQLAGSTLLSFLEAYRDSTPPDETHPEAQFVLALCGIITNIAASTYGRDFLCNCEAGKGLIYTLCSVLGTIPPGSHYAKLCNLILMALYNVSINQSGARYLHSNTSLLSQLVRLLQDENDSINRLHILKLLQSMILEPESVEYVQRALSTIPNSVVQRLSTDLNPEIQNTALEVLRDLATLRRHGIPMSS